MSSIEKSRSILVLCRRLLTKMKFSSNNKKDISYWKNAPIYVFIKQNYRDDRLSEVDTLLLQYYTSLLHSNKMYQDLSIKYKGVGERSIEETAGIVGLKLPKLYKDSNS